jgi:hypothetical protein
MADLLKLAEDLRFTKKFEKVYQVYWDVFI